LEVDLPGWGILVSTGIAVGVGVLLFRRSLESSRARGLESSRAREL